MQEPVFGVRAKCDDVQRELLDNGGMNWDDDFRNMLYTFREYLRYGNPLEDLDAWIDEIIDALKDGDVHDGMIYRLCYCAESWVQKNPEVMPLLDGNYTR